MSDRHPSGVFSPTGHTDEIGNPSYGTLSYDGYATYDGYQAPGHAPEQTYAQAHGQPQTHAPAHGYDGYEAYQGGWDSAYGWEQQQTPAAGTATLAPEHEATATATADGQQTYAGYDAYETYGSPVADPYDTPVHGTPLYEQEYQPESEQEPGTAPGMGAETHGDPDTATAAGPDTEAPYERETAEDAGGDPSTGDAWTPEPWQPSEGPQEDLQDECAPERPAGRGRRRCVKPKRSAFLSVAAPSLAVLGMTAVATAATVSTSDSVEDEPPVAAPDPGEAKTVEANKEFDTQLESLSAAVDDYADRANRTQGRIDLEERLEQERLDAEAEAARIEAERPKFALPVDQRGLSSYYGQAGINWLSLHTGIDFPVSYGTPVKAATDGTIRTQWHISYGNLLILTAADGTETWYAHLSSTTYQSGYVQAGTVIAYSGNSGNSTGPHLHFEVRPASGGTIDPLTWLRNKGLEPN
ncbi:peptidoglycan DD-metalloendopeptidase family protein [Streptomyces xiamenensis]|uniref:peptidoglycan DD-metalloendopeptidase family protein n=1 Tax=Streptomyces xiamenensis TaxID=408015 RepID=UPI00344A4A0B